jgi:hypothetical protein
MRPQGSARWVTVALTAAVGAAVAGLLQIPSAAAATRAAPASSAITRSAHIGYLSCHAPDVLLSATIQRQSFVQGQLVTYKVSIRDLSHAACGYENGTTVPTNAINPAAGLLGPCGELPVQIENGHETVVYPATGVGCPAILGPPLRAGQTISTTGTWNQSAAFGGRFGDGLPLVARGEYHIVIDEKVTLPVDLTGPSSVAPPAGLPPRSSPLPTPSTPAQPLPNLPAPTVPSPLPTPTTTSPTTSTTQPTPSGHPVTRSAHVAFDGCSAKNLTLTVSLPAGSSSSVPVRYDVTVHNGGNTACGAAFRRDPPFARQFRVGECSAMPATFVNAFGVDVYPGSQVVMCPMFAGPYIAPHSTVTTTGIWPGSEYLAVPGGISPKSQTAPPGKYSLVVDHAVDVPFTLTASL